MSPSRMTALLAQYVSLKFLLFNFLISSDVAELSCTRLHRMYNAAAVLYADSLALGFDYVVDFS